MAECLLDTSILLRLINSNDLQHALAVDAVTAIEMRRDEPVLLTQVLIEFWVVATRPTDVNGLGWGPPQAAVEVEGLTSRFRVLSEPTDVLEVWLELVKRYSVSGKHALDVRLVACANQLGVSTIVTFNDSDFASMTEISVVHPRDLAPGPR